MVSNSDKKTLEITLKEMIEKNTKKYTLNEIRDFVDEYFYLRCNEEILRDEEYGDPTEHGQIELNQFLKWLGAKKPIGDKLGWSNVKKSCIGKRKEDPKEVKKKAKKLAKTMNPEELWR